MEDNNNVSVRYKFKNKEKIHVAMITRNQFENLKEIDMIEYCEVINQ